MDHKLGGAVVRNGEFHEPDPASPLLNLPEEIWSLILEYIPQKDLLEHRVVNKTWCRLTDTLANYHVRFCDNQDRDRVETLFMQRVRSCEFNGLKSPFEPNFGNPLLIKEITFASGSSSGNVKRILETCRNVERLIFNTTFRADSLFDHSQDYVHTWNGLKKLKEIEIGIQCFQTREPESISSIFESLICKRNFEFPSLQRFIICFPLFAREWVALFNFFVRHASSLKYLKIRCFKCPDLDELSEMEVSGLEKLNLSNLDIICDSACRHSAVHSAFAKLVSSQRNLVKVSLDLLKFPLSSYTNIVLNNYGSLRSVKFYHVDFGSDHRIDGSLFSECVYLNELTLHCYPRYTVVISVEEPEEGMIGNHMNPNPRYEGADVVGWELPTSLVRLSLKGCHIPTTELIELSSKHSTNLQEIELYGVGSLLSAGFGLTFEAFMQICENLNELKVFGFRGITLSTLVSSDMDKQRWKRLVEKAEAHGVCKHREAVGAFSFQKESDKAFTFKFESSMKRTKFLMDVKQMLSVLDNRSNNGDAANDEDQNQDFEFEFEGPFPKRFKMGI